MQCLVKRDNKTCNNPDCFVVPSHFITEATLSPEPSTVSKINSSPLSVLEIKSFIFLPNRLKSQLSQYNFYNCLPFLVWKLPT